MTRMTLLGLVLGVSLTPALHAGVRDGLALALGQLVDAGVNVAPICEEGDSKCLKKAEKARAKWEKVGRTLEGDPVKALSQAGGLVKKLEKSDSLEGLVRGAVQSTVETAAATYLGRISFLRATVSSFETPDESPLERFSKSIDKVADKAAAIEERFLGSREAELGNFLKKSAGIIKGATRLEAKIEKYIEKRGLVPPADLALVGEPCGDWFVECIGEACRTEVMINVANLGTASAGPFVIRVTFDPDAVAVDFPVSGLGAGVTETFTISSPEGGNCLNPDCGIFIELDANGEIPETNEENNIGDWNCVND